MPAVCGCCAAAVAAPLAGAAGGFGRTEVRRKVTVGASRVSPRLLGGTQGRKESERTSVEEREGREGDEGDVDGFLRVPTLESVAESVEVRQRKSVRTCRNQ